MYRRRIKHTLTGGAIARIVRAARRRSEAFSPGVNAPGPSAQGALMTRDAGGPEADLS